MSHLLGKLYRLSPEKIVNKIKTITRRSDGEGAPSAVPVTEQFLRSVDYSELMSRHLPFGGVYDLHEAQNETASYRFRHGPMLGRLGIFRWRGIQRHLDMILGALSHCRQTVVDLGGAACPLGFGSEIVDLQTHDLWGKPVVYSSLDQVPDKIGMVFSSHTLEHVPDLEVILKNIRARLSPGGHLILHLPSFYCERWRAGIHRNDAHHDHVWTFGLDGTGVPQGLVNYVAIDKLVGDFFHVQKREYCGDDSILVLAQNSVA